ncbi:MAG: DUF2857 family protein [Gammaproteobacteria bacterium]|nr:DUF2857 family protein [Gammaproteobacteria bacterium]
MHTDSYTHLIIAKILKLYTRGGFNEVKESGIRGLTKVHLDRLASMTVTQLDQFCEVPVDQVTRIVFSEERLDIVLKLWDARQQDQANQENLIRWGASLPLMEEEFGMSGAEYAALRRKLNIDTNGRPPKLSEEDELRVLRLWQEHKSLPSRQRWLALGQAGIPLNSAWTVIQQARSGEAFGDDSDLRPAGSAKK